jgi:putative transposase
MIPLQPNISYHIFNHANGLENIFREEKNYLFFLEKYSLHISAIAETYAWCLIPNHFHLVIRLRKRETIIALMLDKKQYYRDELFQSFKLWKSSNYRQRNRKISIEAIANLFSSYTQSFNKVYHRMGALFIKNFKREPIYDKAHFLNAIVYVHRNPIHHGFCNDFKEWPNCSYNSILSADSHIVQTEKLLKMTGGIDEFVKMHNDGLEKLVNSTHFDIL